jgi:hypothetical protein
MGSILKEPSGHLGLQNRLFLSADSLVGPDANWALLDDGEKSVRVLYMLGGGTSGAGFYAP